MTTNNNISVNQRPVHGDKKALHEFESGMKAAPSSGALVPDRGPGRPRTAGAAAPAAGPAEVDPKVVQDMQIMAITDQARAFFRAAAERFPHPYTKVMLDDASSDFDRLAWKIYNETGNIE